MALIIGKRVTVVTCEISPNAYHGKLVSIDPATDGFVVIDRNLPDGYRRIHIPMSNVAYIEETL